MKEKDTINELLDRKPANVDVYDVTTETFEVFYKMFKKQSTMINALTDEIVEKYPIVFDAGKDLGGRQENYEYFYDAIQAALRKVLNAECDIAESKKYFINDYNV